MTAKTVADRLAESRERTKWLELAVASKQLGDAIKRRDADSASIALEACEEAVAKLRGEDPKATDAD